MQIRYKLIIFLLAMAGWSTFSCKDRANKEAPEDKQVPVGTPVTVTTISTVMLEEYVELNATSTFLQKSYVKANVTGYIQTANTQQGKFVTAGQTLFTIKTKEAQSLDNAVNKLDPSFRFSGVNNIKAGSAGYITQLNHQAGDYVQDGEQLAAISDVSSFVFLLNLPYELKRFVPVGSVLDMSLADGTGMKGTVTAALPTVDPGSQTQSMVIKVPGGNIPENLIAKVMIVKSKKENAVSLPKAAVLTNDVQNEFWVMKMIDQSTAVKVPVKKGLETKERVEILSPVFTPADKIVLTGNYGLPDTAKVKIVQ